MFVSHLSVPSRAQPLLDIRRRPIPEPDVMGLVETIVDNGRGVLDDEYRNVRAANGLTCQLSIGPQRGHTGSANNKRRLGRRA